MGKELQGVRSQAVVVGARGGGEGVALQVPGVPSGSEGVLGEGDGLRSDEVYCGRCTRPLRVEEGSQAQSAAGVCAAADRSHGGRASNGGGEEEG